MLHTTNTLTRRLATKLLGRPAARSARLGVESLEQRDNPAGTITGFVFQDFNANGMKDTPANITNAGNGTVADATDRGIGGVTVTAFDAGNTPQGKAVTDAAGNYTLNATGTGGYRVEFTALPEGLQPGPQGADSKTAVQFVPDGNRIDVSVGLVRPGDFAQRNPLLATSRYVFGDQVSGANRAEATIVAFPYSSGGTDGGYTNAAPATLVTAAQVARRWGWRTTPSRMTCSPRRTSSGTRGSARAARGRSTASRAPTARRRARRHFTPT